MPEHYVSNLDADARKSSINLLKPALAAAIDLQLAVKQAHWTIKGPSFIGLHELLDEVATRSYEHSDTIAERLVILGGQTHGTTQEVAKNTCLEAYPADITDQKDHVEALTKRFMDFGAMCRDGIAKAGDNGDEDTADLFTEISREVDKDAWFIGAHNA
ncbi:DNA protection during starvation protein [Litorimonas cladophorae]|uniref:DNA protection during starvation protein n=1 Tax=Litorimonas cladophorae TaxID=1220491 RepID=A0A918KSW0_9PROT|nr:DNA starvation/stationary phase protection protein Dps [Litorimonas cladophorae]GGX74831.1 DNA protection during starvation protein [Litorimonas cladophorae]